MMEWIYTGLLATLAIIGVCLCGSANEEPKMPVPETAADETEYAGQNKNMKDYQHLSVAETSRCTVEHKDQSLRPAIKPADVDFAKVDTVFIGFPIWWHEEPAVIRYFLDDYRDQLKGKVLYPFCTSYESPMSEADATLRKGYPDYDWKTGLRLPASREEIEKWINQ